MLATGQFLHRRVKAGRPWLRVLFLGDTDELAVPGDPAVVALEDAADSDEFERAPRAVLRDIVGGGISLPWNLVVAGMLGIALLFTRVTLGAEGSMADAHHIIGCLVLTVVAIAAAEVARPVRVLSGVLGIGLMLVPLIVDGDKLTVAVTLVTGLTLVLLSLRRGPIRERYGAWNRQLV